MVDTELPEPTGMAAQSRRDEHQSGPAALLAQVTRVLAAVPEDADDAVLLERLGDVVVPALGDVVALFVADVATAPRLAGVAPRAASLARQVTAEAERRPERVSEYVAQADGRGARLVTTGTFASLVAAASEIVAPLGGGGQRDGVLAIGTTDPGRAYTADELAAVEVVAVLVANQRTARALARREETLRRELEAAAMAGRELAHTLNNDLTMPVGVVELLLDRSGISPDLFEMLQAASKDLAALEEHVRAFHDQMRAASLRVSAPPSD